MKLHTFIDETLDFHRQNSELSSMKLRSSGLFFLEIPDFRRWNSELDETPDFYRQNSELASMRLWNSRFFSMKIRTFIDETRSFHRCNSILSSMKIRTFIDGARNCHRWHSETPDFFISRKLRFWTFSTCIWSFFWYVVKIWSYVVCSPLLIPPWVAWVRSSFDRNLS